jgi:thiol-disulfide isomerase/thioredoxin
MKKAAIAALIVLALALTACAEEVAAGAEELAVGAKAPGFTLVNAVDRAKVTMKPADGMLKAVIFTCNQCPYAKAFEPRIIEIANKFRQQGVVFYAIDSNDERKFDEETLQNMKARAVEKEYPYPYLKDGNSAVARAYGARVTPHVFVVDGAGVLRYRGYVDDTAKPEERKTTGLTDALGALLNGRDVANADTRAFGCTIKFVASASR